jgi:hypothetical protein
VMDAMEAADAGAIVDVVLGQPEPQQLPSRHNPVLPLRQPRDGAVRLT